MFRKWWAWYWNYPIEKLWLPVYYETVAKDAFQEGKISVLSTLEQKTLIKFLNSQEV